MRTKALLAILAIALAANAQTPGSGGPESSGPKSGDEEVFSIGPGITPPRVVRQIQPEHPAKGFRISGTVLIGLVITSKGEPKELHVIKSLEKDIDQSAIDAVAKWVFEPARKDGKPVAVKLSVEIRFHDM